MTETPKKPRADKDRDRDNESHGDLGRQIEMKAETGRHGAQPFSKY